jgi:hypothetical protein
MAEVKSFLSDLDDAVARGTAESRERALWHATDLLIAGRYSDDEIWTFGEVIGRLADEIEVAARAQLSKRLVSTMPRSTSSTSLPLTIRSTSRAPCSGSPSSSTIMP